MTKERQELTSENAARLVWAAKRGNVRLCVINSAEEEAAAIAEGWSGDYEALPAPKPSKEKLEWLARELSELCRLQREGAFGPILDTGRYEPFSFMQQLAALFQADRESQRSGLLIH